MTQDNAIKINQESLTVPKTLSDEISVPTKARRRVEEDNRYASSVVLRQSPVWSRAVLWGLLGTTTYVGLWANFAKIEEAVPTQGMLEPQGAVKDIQVPVGGVVKEVYVKDGGKVKRGDLLLRMDTTTAEAQLSSLTKVKAALSRENQFYRAQLLGTGNKYNTQVNLPPGIASLTKSRMALVSENRLYQAQLSGNSQNFNLSPEETARLEFSKDELNTRAATDKLQTEQLRKQLSETQVQLSSAKDIKEVNQGILQNLEPLVKQGAISRLQFLKQVQEVRTMRANVDRLTQEQARIRYAIAQSKKKLKNTLVAAKRDLAVKIAQNRKQIAQIDSDLNKAIVENNKRITELNSQISQAQVNLKHQVLKAPADGIIFDLKASSQGFVASATQPVMKIVPNEALVAKVYVTNKDIGFIKKGMKVDVRIDSFPFSEFGDIKGEITWIGSDALPPDQVRPFYSFPVKIRLDEQTLSIKQRQLALQSGMSVSANIKVRDRTIMSIFTDSITEQFDNLKQVR
ncbi:MAG: HlyD family efflux transporter periplasmic adaptor subunit [Cyanobacteria bacterium P01_A01_bin.84]